MAVLELCKHAGGIGLAERIQGLDHGRFERQRLQRVQPVAHAHRAHARAALAGRIVPGCPGLARARQEGLIRVQHDAIGLVAHAAENAALAGIRVGQHLQRLVAVTAENGVVEALAAAVRIHLDACRDPANLPHRRGQSHVAQAGGESAHILASATAHGAPLRPAIDLQQAVVVAEAQEVAAGYAAICWVGQDQMAAAIGSRYQSRKAGP